MNSRLDRKKFKFNYPALGFLIPCVGMLIVMMLCHYEPFGKTSMLYSDMYHQYFPFFVAFRNALRRGESLLYNWNVGLGMDYLGLISYYLASPLNLLSVLIPESWVLEYFSLLMPLKLGFAGMFFAMFLKYCYGKDDFSISVFGGFYALCAWALGYQWNIMWLDTFALLPLVAMGTVKLIKERKFILYTLTLFLSVYANYYIGFFTCIFVFFLFFCCEICCWKGFRAFFMDLLRIAFFSLLAIGMTMVLEMPALMALQSTQSSVNKFPDSFRLNMTTDHTIKGMFEVMKKVTGNLGGGLEPTFKEGLPNLYCGVAAIFLGILYMTAKDVKLREKLCGLFLLTFIELSFIIRQLDYIWHGFHFTNMIPYRFSFLYSFVLLCMAYKAWTLRNSLGIFRILLAGAGTAGILWCSEDLMSTRPVELGGNSYDVHVFLIYNSVFLLLYMAVMIWGRVRKPLPENADHKMRQAAERNLCRRRAYVRCVALGICMLELLATLFNFGFSFSGTSVEYYPRGKEDTASAIRYMKERKPYDLFYRTEATHSQTLNDGALNDYYGISTFTSSANVRVTEFMKALGYGAKNTYNRYCFEESSPVANLFLGLKYMLDRAGRDRSSTWFTEVHHFGNVHLLENNAYLPLGFLANMELQLVDFRQEGDRFWFQDNLLAAATGLDHPVWHILGEDTRVVTGENTLLGEVSPEGRVDYTESGDSAKVIYSFVPDEDGFACIYLDFPKRNSFSVRINDVEQYQENISLPQMLAVGDVKSGDLVEVIATVKSGESSNMTVEAALLNEDRFRESYEILNQSTMEVTSFRSSRVEGFIDCNRDGLLYTSIPQNGNWQVTVDGTPVQDVMVGDAMLAVPLTKGEHVLTFRYRNPAFTMGLAVSLFCFAVFGVFACRDLKLSGKLPGKRKKTQQ